MSDKEYAAALGGGEKRDELYEEALKIVVEMGRASTSVLQRRLRIGYGRAASIIDMMEREGYVEPADGPRPRAITRKALEFRERLRQMEA
jgi:S-DNA-T family DNA segregation ATPase FtsK/SpoIIIE